MVIVSRKILLLFWGTILVPSVCSVLATMRLRRIQAGDVTPGNNEEVVSDIALNVRYTRYRSRAKSHGIFLRRLQQKRS